MLSTNNQVKSIITNKRVEPMRNQYVIAPWSLRLGVLGLALSVSPLFMEAVLAKSKPAVKASPVPAKVAVEPAGYPLDKAAAARKPEERGLVNTQAGGKGVG
ncbi:MAG: hypothetical protein K0R76_944 [Alphaproteobacteria bacterium]|nr:hypothetical protein [Alphaproteobacteria bacterium]